MLTAAGVLSILNFTFVPWGNEYFAAVTGNTTYDRETVPYWLETCGMGVTAPPAGCFEGKILCQHGENECAVNTIEGCAIKAFGGDVKQYWPLITCLEGMSISHTDPKAPDAALNSCAKTLGWSAATLAAVQGCVDSPSEAAAVKVANAKATAALVPAHLGTPWILVNGEVYDDSTGTLLEAVCGNYTGAKPAGCK